MKPTNIARQLQARYQQVAIPSIRPANQQHHHLDEEEQPMHHQRPPQPQIKQEQVSSNRDPLDLTFNDTGKAYKSKTMKQLMRSYFVLGLCSNDFLVKNNDKLMKLTRSVFGKRFFEKIMRSTFYGQFVAGVNEQDIVPAIKQLSSFGVKSILDYSAEEDVQEDAMSEEFADIRTYLPVARTYFYRGEVQCERHLEIFFKAIEAVAQSTSNTGFAAIKLTALGQPKLLMKLSKIIEFMNSIEGQTKAQSMSDLLNTFNSLKQDKINPLNEDEEEMLFNLMRRVNRIAAYASQVGGARCMIDAEQTYMQPAINLIAMELMRQYNRREPIIFNTYQCYLKEAFNHVNRDLAIARRENFCFAAKLVRGAYMDQERARAKKLGYADPINESFDATSKMYEKTLSYLMGEIQHELELDSVLPDAGPGKRRVSLMVASHNEDGIRFTLEQMRARGIEPHHKVICFGQLYGMCDHVSFILGQAGFSVYKYMPYGQVEEVLPYLGRRAIENHGFLSKLERERTLLGKEIVDRLLSMRWFYKPVGNYKPV